MTRLASTSALALFLGAAPALADVTADEVWDSWKTAITDLGQTIETGSEVRNGNVLTLSDVTTIIELPERSGTITSSLPEVILTENADGSVRIDLAPEYRMLLSLTDGDERVEMTLAIAQTGFVGTVTGAAGDLDFATRGETFTITLDDMKANGEPVDAAAVAVLSGLSGTYSLDTDGSLTRMTQAMAFERLTLNGSATDPKEPTEITFGAEIAALALSLDSTDTGLPATASFEEQMNAGLRIAASASHGAVSANFDFKTVDGKGQVSGAAEGGSFSVSMDREALDYAQSGRGLTMTIKYASEQRFAQDAIDGSFNLGDYRLGGHIDWPNDLSTIETENPSLRDGFSMAFDAGITDLGYATTYIGPFFRVDGKGEIAEASSSMTLSEDGLAFDGMVTGLDVDTTSPDELVPSVGMSFTELNTHLTMPAVASDTATDTGFSFALRDLVVSEPLWARFDPEAILPRDPATLVVAVSGKMRLLIDIFDSEAGTDFVTEPAEMQEFSLDTLEISAVGASMTGSGALSFDYTDRISYPGNPKPVGTMEYRLTGVSGLIDKLITMGLIPPTEAMGTRMMIGMFARPGDTPDSLVSELEFTEDGHFIANGMTIK